MRGENNQNLGRNLPMNEAKMSRKKFIQYLTDSARLDPKNFKLGNVVIEGDNGPENWPVIVGEHVLKRGGMRTFMLQDEIMSKAISILAIPMIGQEVVSHRVIWDDDEQATIDFDGDGINATTIKIEAENLVLVFEAGLSYIRVKTIWSGNIREKITYNTSVITIAKSGAIGFEA